METFSTAELEGMIRRAQGCLLGQLAGDALGSLVEFRSAEEIGRRYPGGVRDLADGGVWGTLAGQPTDDSEMALALAHVLVEKGCYDPARAREAYVAWLKSGPFDCGATVRGGLTGRPNPHSQSNGALMRISPLGIFGAAHPPELVGEWARQDAAITHVHRVCLEANALFAMAIAYVIRHGCGPRELYERLRAWAAQADVGETISAAIRDAAERPPADYSRFQGWVLVAFGNALWQLLHAPTLEEGVVDTVMRGGDTDTNAAICGALLGAVYGRDAVPERWTRVLLACRPEAGRPGVRRPRPREYWPVNAPELAERLVRAGIAGGSA
ncbi:MAG: ADP-ribosylglycohydrolase family protein [Bryobacterales bacterium]|nr:ADP-ribosylglycohydrolase family protein [Bryobacterales bacterium]